MLYWAVISTLNAPLDWHQPVAVDVVEYGKTPCKVIRGKW